MNQGYRPTWIEVDLESIKTNIKTIQAKHPEQALFAVIKANAYGHGAIEVARCAIEAGAVYLAVSSLDEAIQLRENQIKAPILILGAIEPNQVKLAAQHSLTVTAMSLEWLEKAVKQEDCPSLKIHLKLNTGMNRLGLKTIQQVRDALELCRLNPVFEVEGVFTHFATADESESTYFADQLDRFLELTNQLDLTAFKYVHVSNTATILRTSVPNTTAIRLGIGMYGMNPNQIEEVSDLKPALTLYSQLTQVHELEMGDCVGYGATYQARETEWIGTIPIGYADGWWRENQGRCVVIQGVECPIIGRVCMDQLMVKLPQKCEPGTKVTLIGEGMPLTRVANELKTISYEVLCGLSDRIPRVYHSTDGESCNRMRFERNRKKRMSKFLRK